MVRSILTALSLLLALATPASAKIPKPDHIVIVIEENRFYREVVGSPNAPYITSLAKHGANFTNAHGITHPSAPNYFALFAGRINSNGNDCPEQGFSPNDPNLGSQLLAARLSFGAYSGGLPRPGYQGCEYDVYARKHAPWVFFKNIPADLHKPYQMFPPPQQLPTVAFVVPNLNDDMHDGTVKQGDEWLQAHMADYVHFADTTNSLLIVTWDEGFDLSNSIPTIIYGKLVKPGNYATPMNAYVLLRTIEAMYGLPALGHAAGVAPVTQIWR
jgi:acid phosphatase